MTAKELRHEIEQAERDMHAVMEEKKARPGKRNVLLDSLPRETAEMLERMRLLEDE